MKHLTTILSVLLILAVSLLIGFAVQDSLYSFSQHRWFEGHREDVIFDVMENYVYPGVSASDAEAYLGTGSDDADELKAPLLQAFLSESEQTAIETVFTVNVYPLQNPPSSDDGIKNSYFAVIHDGTTVLKTMLVHSNT